METLKRKLSESNSARWGILILVGFVLMTNYYFYDAFSTLKDDLKNQFSFSNTQYGLFVSFYSIPNTFLLMAVLGGIILDKLGIRRTGSMFIGFMTLGALLTAYGASDYFSAGGFGYEFFNSFWPSYSPQLKVMLLGRFFFGLGAETSIVVVSKILVKWFKGGNLALAFGLKVGFGRLGTFLALNVSPAVSENGLHLSNAIWLAAILVLTGFLAFLIYLIYDTKYDKETNTDNIKEKSTQEKFEMSDLTSVFKNSGWVYIALLCVTFYSAIFPFMAFAPDFFNDKYGFDAKSSGFFSSILPVSTAIFTPLFGLFIDRVGKSSLVMILGALGLIVIHLSFAFTNIHPLVPMVVLGIVFSAVPGAMWPSMVKLVKEKQIGTAYGAMYSIQNLGLWAIPLLVGYLLDATNPADADILNYQPVMIMFAALGVVGLIFAIGLRRTDRKNGFGIDLPLNKKR